MQETGISRDQSNLVRHASSRQVRDATGPARSCASAPPCTSNLVQRQLTNGPLWRGIMPARHTQEDDVSMPTWR